MFSPLLFIGKVIGEFQMNREQPHSVWRQNLKSQEKKRCSADTPYAVLFI